MVSAVLNALKNGGYRSVTTDGIAREVGRARTSNYRRWPSKRKLVAYAVVNEMGDRPSADTGSIRGDLESAVTTLVRAFAGPLGSALPGLVGDMAQDPQLAASIRQQVLAVCRQLMSAALERGQQRGEVCVGLETELVLDMLTGPFYFLALLGHATITRDMPTRVVNYALRIINS